MAIDSHWASEAVGKEKPEGLSAREIELVSESACVCVLERERERERESENLKKRKSI